MPLDRSIGKIVVDSVYL